MKFGIFDYIDRRDELSLLFNRSELFLVSSMPLWRIRF